MCGTRALLCPADARNMLLLLFPLDHQIKFAVACSARILREAGCGTAKPCGNSNILDKVPREIWAILPDYATSKLKFMKYFPGGFPIRAEWKADSMLQGYGTVLFTLHGDGLWSRLGSFLEYTRDIRVLRSSRFCKYVPSGSIGDTGSLPMAGA